MKVTQSPTHFSQPMILAGEEGDEQRKAQEEFIKRRAETYNVDCMKNNKKERQK